MKRDVTGALDPLGAVWSRRRWLQAAAALPLGAVLATAARAQASAEAGGAAPLRVVASFSILADLVREVAPPDARVHALVGPEADAHAHAATPGDVRRLPRPTWWSSTAWATRAGWTGWWRPRATAACRWS